MNCKREKTGCIWCSEGRKTSVKVRKNRHQYNERMKDMRRKKNIWFSRRLAGFMCLSLMVLCMLPVSAAERGHVHQFELKDETIHNKITSYNAGTHTVIYYKTGVCACSKRADVVVGSAEVAHSLSFSDEGHDRELHHYRGNCVCGYSTLVTLHCAGNNTHIRP